MDAEITITVIIPVYNVEKYLTQCLESIIGQSVPFDEVILINDGSIDKSRLICESYVSEYDFFRLINQENRGLSAARNVGLKHAVSEYVLFLDSDDYLRADTAKQLKAELKKFKQDAVYFDADIQCERGYEAKKNNFIRDIKGLADIRMSGELFFRKCYPASYMVPVWLAVYRKEKIETTGILFPEGLYYEDNYFTFAFMMQACHVTYIPEKLYRRRYRENSIITSAYSEKKFTDFMKIVLLVWKVVDGQKNISLPENKIFMKFINDYCSISLSHRNLCAEKNIALHEDAAFEFFTMVRAYVYLAEKYCHDGGIEYLNILNGILGNMKEIFRYCPEYGSCCTQFMERTVRRQTQLYKELLCNLPLGVKECKVGIYGTGKHTEGLLAIYENLIGKISCHLVFLDSYKENGNYLGWDIISCQQIDSSFDVIIISSYLYEREMIENVRKINKTVSIYTFYDNLDEDVFSRWDLWRC